MASEGRMSFAQEIGAIHGEDRTLIAAYGIAGLLSLLAAFVLAGVLVLAASGALVLH